MRVITKEDNIKLGIGDTGESLLINKIPLHHALKYFAMHREYTKEKTAKYIKDYFEIDLSLIVDDINLLWAEHDIYEEFRDEYPLSLPNIDKKTEFKNRYRNYYYKFIDWIDHISHQDYIYGAFPAEDVHHIFPLVYGGRNELENLVHIGKFHHELLHCNPLENEEKYCHQAVIYLHYLSDPWIKEKNDYLGKIYDFTNFNDPENNFAAIDYYKFMIKNEMMKFYNELKSNRTINSLHIS